MALDSCFPCLRSCELTQCFNNKTVAVLASAVLLATITGIVIGALMIQYPSSHWLILGIPSALALGSFVVLCVSIALMYRSNTTKSATGQPGTTLPDTPPEYNPFA